MIPIERLDPRDARRIRYVLCDIDDTITTGGKLPAGSYGALWSLHDAGIRVVPVTGRPAGWCDLIVREWPVAAVIGENGAFVNYFEGSRLMTFLHPSVASGDIQGRLEAVKQACLKGVPGCRVARDQPFRRFDLAIDFAEDPPRLSLEEAERIRAICVNAGAQAKISSIHVNAWFGDYDKVSMARLFLQKVFGEPDPRECCIFFGDSPNDEPMFSYFPLTCAVANIKPFVPRIRRLPAFVTEREGGEGFADAVGRLLRARGGS